MADAGVVEQLAAPPRSSVEKLEALLAELAAAQGADTTQRLLLSTLRGLLPTLRRAGYIPDDAADLDRVLLIGARMALGLRSDTAWQPDTIDDLFLGPAAAPDAPQED